MQFIAALVMALAVVDAGVVDRETGNSAYGINALPYFGFPFATYPGSTADAKQITKLRPMKLQPSLPYIAPFYPPIEVIVPAVESKDAVEAKNKVETASAIATPYGYPSNYFYGGYPFGPLVYPGRFGFFPLYAKSATEVKSVETVVKAVETIEVKPVETAKAVDTTYVA